MRNTEVEVMRPVMTILPGVIVLSVLSLFCVAFAQQDVNFFCKTECLEKAGRTLGDCNTLCSTRSESGAKTKDENCLSSCMGKSNETAYSCYSACDGGSAGAVGSGQSPPQPLPGMGYRP
jgi:hypothetical protein